MRVRGTFSSVSVLRQEVGKEMITFLGEHIKSLTLHNWVDCDSLISLSFVCRIYVKIAFKYTVKVWAIQG